MVQRHIIAVLSSMKKRIQLKITLIRGHGRDTTSRYVMKSTPLNINDKNGTSSRDGVTLCSPYRKRKDKHEWKKKKYIKRTRMCDSVTLCSCVRNEKKQKENRKT